MKVILLKDVAKVGRIHDVKEVSDGFALNSLIPRGLAKIATPQALAQHEKGRSQANAAHAALEAKRAQALKALEGGAAIRIMVQADKGGHLYRKLDAKALAEHVSAYVGSVVPPEAIILDAPIKTLGESHIEVAEGKKRYPVLVEVVGV